MEKSRRKIIITDPVHAVFMDEWERCGVQCDYQPGIAREDLLACVADYEALVVSSRIAVGRELLDRAVALRVVGRLGSGMEHIDEAYASSKGITCLSSPEGNRQSVAEHALGMLLCLMNHIHTADGQVRAYEWRREENRGTELSGKTVGIIGYGNTGSAFAAVLPGFGVRILAYDKYRKGFGGDGVEEALLQDIFEHADVVSLHIPLTNETKGMVNKSFLERFKKPAYLLNTSRGSVVDTLALAGCLEKGRLAGAALDVLENEDIANLNDGEKFIFERLIRSNRVILTPHIAGWTEESYRKTAVVLREKMMETLSGM